MKVRKAVIVAAGMGTRMLPASKVIPKEILPVVDKPAIQIVVEEAVASGIEEIVVVISPGRTTVVDHFDPAPEAVDDEPFAVMLPDDIFDSKRPCLRQLLDVAESEDAPVVALLKVARSEIPKYGIVVAKPVRPRLYELSGMVEKPPAEKAPSDLAIMGRYVLTPDIFPLLADGKPGAGGEIQLTDALLELAKRRKLYGYEFEGARYDLGDKAGFIAAQVRFGLKRPELADSLRAYLKSALKL